MITEKDLELIHKYATDKLCEKEIELFGEKIKEPEFAQKARDYTLTVVSLQTANEIQNEYFAKQINKTNKRRYLNIVAATISVAAACIIIVLTINWFLYNNKSALKYNYLTEVSEQIPGNKGSGADNYSKATIFYYKADSLKLLVRKKEAKRMFDSAGFYFETNYKQTDTFSDKMNLYFAGLSYMYSNNIEQAQKCFEKTITIFDKNKKYEKSFFFRSHRWLTVIYVHTDDFTNIKSSLSYYKSGINEILKSSDASNEQAILLFLSNTENYLKNNEK